MSFGIVYTFVSKGALLLYNSVDNPILHRRSLKYYISKTIQPILLIFPSRLVVELKTLAGQNPFSKWVKFLLNHSVYHPHYCYDHVFLSYNAILHRTMIKKGIYLNLSGLNLVYSLIFILQFNVSKYILRLTS